MESYDERIKADLGGEIDSLRERVAELELTLDTVREHERREERARIRRELLAWMRIERAEGRAMTPGRLERALDRIVPENG